MRSYWSDSYLWIHLAGIAAVPLMLELCLIGFAIGDPFLPAWLELFLVGAIGIAPILWMQWQRPFYIFSLLAVSLKPEQLTEDQRRLLTLFKSQRNRIAAALVPVVLLLLLQKVYGLAPIAVSASLFPGEWRLAGLAVAAIGFLACNLFTQVPVAVLAVMLHSDTDFAATNPYSLGQIRANFSVYGFRVNQILPPLVTEAPLVVATAPPIASPPIPVSEVGESQVLSEAEADLDELDAEVLKDADSATESVTETSVSAETEFSTTEFSTTDLPLAEAVEPAVDQVPGEAGVIDGNVTDGLQADEIADVAADVTLPDVESETTLAQSDGESENVLPQADVLPQSDGAVETEASELNTAINDLVTTDPAVTAEPADDVWRE